MYSRVRIELLKSEGGDGIEPVHFVAERQIPLGTESLWREQAFLHDDWLVYII